jgi:hypothetical protein
MDRRRFLTGAAVLLAGASWARAPMAVASGPALSRRRRAAFRALVRALRSSPDGRFATVGTSTVSRRLVGWYSGQTPATRARVDALLDEVAAAGVPAYARLARGASRCTGASAARRRAALAGAVDLVAGVCEPPPAADERPPAPALGLPA